MNKYLFTPTDAQKNKALTILTMAGYKLNSLISRHLRDWPACWYPYLCINQNNVISSGAGYGRDKENMFTLGQLLDAANVNKPRIVFPEPAKYKITYTKEDGETSEYIISNPVECDSKKITAYAFGRGIRSFVKERISAFKKV